MSTGTDAFWRFQLVCADDSCIGNNDDGSTVVGDLTSPAAWVPFGDGAFAGDGLEMNGNTSSTHHLQLIGQVLLMIMLIFIHCFPEWWHKLSFNASSDQPVM